MSFNVQQINCNDLWLYPFGTEVVFDPESEYPDEIGTPVGIWYYVGKSELGSELRNDFGVELYISGDYDINIHVGDLEDLVANFIKGLGASTISLMEEPEMHKDIIEFNLVTLKYMSELKKIIKGEDGSI
jgi:hypothetical protein